VRCPFWLSRPLGDGVRRLDRNSTIKTPLIPGWSLAICELIRKKDRQYF
jgi:hypothetical protein